MSTIPVIPGSNAKALAAAVGGSQVSPTKGGDTIYLIFEAKREGEWLLGKEREVVTGEKIVVDLTSVRHGYHRWHQKKLTEVMVAPNQPLPEPPQTIEWVDSKGKTQYSEANEARLVRGKFLDDAPDAPMFEFATSTYGGRKAFDSWWAEVVMRAQAGNPFMFPVIELGADSYEHVEYGLTFSPEMEAVDWADENGQLESATGKIEAPAAEEDDDEPPFDTAAEKEDEAPAEAPKRRRRRAAA